ncbi:T-box transcription factor tbx15 [Plakobranchus ocellatus]|uniref:T-box transcription factor tbx15 n=1 Tax=Plakobranchus ocellatus TaxID=259542 RepID=A0AAV3YDT1_9GAST|nr:T-box transcription factor tbx15 [Plakobranchus ocellatus]
MLSYKAQAFSVENLLRPNPHSAVDLSTPSSSSEQRQLLKLAKVSPATATTRVEEQVRPTTATSPWFHQETTIPKKRRRPSAEVLEEEKPDHIKFQRLSVPSPENERAEICSCSNYHGHTNILGKCINPEKNSFNMSGSSLRTVCENDIQASTVTNIKEGQPLSSCASFSEVSDHNLDANNNHKMNERLMNGNNNTNENIYSCVNASKDIDYRGLPSIETELRRHDSGGSLQEHQYTALLRQSRSVQADLTSQFCFCHGDVPCCGHPGVLSIPDYHQNGRDVLAELIHADLWSSFHGLGTEMIITKSGSGLDPSKMYVVKLDFLQPDSKKYRYIYHNSHWVVSGSGDSLSEAPSYINPEGPISGRDICYQVLSFERLKLTNVDTSRPGQVSLVSMQKFQPRVVIEEHIPESKVPQNRIELRERYEIIFPQTSFIAVTAYQNQQITTLKIASNPFAKGFRDSGKSRPVFYPSSHPFPLSPPHNSGWNCLPSILNVFTLDQKRLAFSDATDVKSAIDLEISGLETLLQLKTSPHPDRLTSSNESQHDLRERVYDYLHSLGNASNVHPTPPGISASCVIKPKHYEDFHLHHINQYFQHSQQYLGFYHQAQQLLLQQQQQQQQKHKEEVEKTIAHEETVRTGNLIHKAPVRGSLCCPPPNGSALPAPDLFHSFTSTFNNTNVSAQTSYPPNLGKLPRPFPQHGHAPRLSSTLSFIPGKNTEADVIRFHQEKDRYFDSRSRSSDSFLQDDSSQRQSSSTSSVISSCSPDPSPIPSNHTII